MTRSVRAAAVILAGIVGLGTPVQHAPAQRSFTVSAQSIEADKPNQWWEVETGTTDCSGLCAGGPNCCKAK